MRGLSPKTVARRRQRHVHLAAGALAESSRKSSTSAFGARVERHRVARARLGQAEALAVAVDRARRREDVPAHALLARGDGEALRAVDVDAARELRLELARRVVRDAREVDHGVDRREERPIEAAHVGRARSRSLSPKRAARARERVSEVEAVEHRDPVALLEEQRHEDRADVAGAAGDEDVHGSDGSITKDALRTSRAALMAIAPG